LIKNNLMASASVDKTARIWNLQTLLSTDDQNLNKSFYGEMF
jgi:hypothetical protein